MFHHRVSPDLELALFEPPHAEPLFQVVDANRAYLRQWLPWVDATRSADDTLAFIRRTQQQFAENNGFQTAIVYRGELAGAIGHLGISWHNRSTELGYWLAEPLQGRGLMTMACRAYLEHAFRDLDLNRVRISAATGNRRSRAVAERLGFQLEGVLRQSEWIYDRFVDQAVYGLLREHWAG